MGKRNTQTVDEWLGTVPKRTIRSWVVELVCRLFNKSLRIIQQTLALAASENDFKELIQKPEAISILRPKTARYVKIDVGLSNDASHSVECLLDHDDRLIIGIEPHPDNIQGLVCGTAKEHSISLKDRVVRHGFNCKYIPELRSRFIVINGAAGSSTTPVQRKFYSAYPDRGNSSLYKIQSPKLTGNITDKEFDVIEFPLSGLLEKIKSMGFEFVETLKIDTEGHELEVLRGCGNNIRQILYCRVECFKGIYDNSRHAKQDSLPAHIILGSNGYTDSATAIIKYLDNYNFRLVSSKPGDYVFLNRDLETLLSKHEIYP
jgi:FkbM family methyltransferase